MPGTYRDYQPQDDQQLEDGDVRFLGVNARLTPDKVPAGFLCNGKNIRMRNGDAVTRRGVIKPGWLNVLNPGADNTVRPVGQFYGAGVFKDPNGEQWVLTCADGNVYRHKVNNPRSQLSLPAGVRLLSRCVPVQAFNSVFLFRGKYLAPLLMTSIDAGFVDIEPLWNGTATYNAFVQVIGQAAQEVAYGAFQTVDSLTSVGGVATVVTHVEHGYITGADITIQGASQSEYNGRFNITVVDASTFTYNFAGSGTPTATGTIKASNMSHYWQALGSRITLGVGELTSSTTTATVTHTAHGFTTGQYVTVAGASPAAYNGTYPINVTGANTFTYTFAGGTSPATGTITCRTSIVLAGQSPDTNPEAWQQLFNVLPNADDALFIDNRLLVPTAYTPGTTSYDSTSTYTKKDFIVAMDIGDNIHFVFTNEFRINQGSQDEIVGLVKFSADQCVVLKETSWGIISGLSGSDLSQVALDMHDDGYGMCAPRAGVAKGQNVLFASDKRGIFGLQQTELGISRSTNIPFSNDFLGVINRINWLYKSGIRLTHWDDKLYAAVPLDDTVTNSVAPGITIDNAYHLQSGFNPSWALVGGLQIGQTYTYVGGNSLELTTDVQSGLTLQPAGTVYSPGATFVATTSTMYLWADYTKAGLAPTAYLTVQLTGKNNAVLVYDFQREGHGNLYTYDFQGGQWDGYDQGSSMCVLEWFKCQVNGRERLGFIGADGWANIMEEAEADQVANPASSTLLGWEQIQDERLTRGYSFDAPTRQQLVRIEVVLGVWASQFSITALTGGAASESPVQNATGINFSRTAYLKPVGKAPYVDGNVNNDFLTAGRGDYSVPLPSGGLGLGSGGIAMDVFQEVVKRCGLSGRRGRYVQLRISNSNGRLSLRGVAPTASDGERRNGVLI